MKREVFMTYGRTPAPYIEGPCVTWHSKNKKKLPRPVVFHPNQQSMNSSQLGEVDVTKVGESASRAKEEASNGIKI